MAKSKPPHSPAPPPPLATNLCIACRSPIPAGATVCLVCKTFQRRLPRIIATYAPYLGGLAVVVSLATLAYSQGAEIYRRWMWADEITVGWFYSPGRSVFLNTGDGDVYITTLELMSQDKNKVINVAEGVLAKKGEITTINPLAVPNNEYLMNETGVASPEIAARLFATACLPISFMSPGMAERTNVEKFYESHFKTKMIAAPIEVYLNYISLHTGKSHRQKLDVTGFIGFTRTPDCEKQDWARGLIPSLPPTPPPKSTTQFASPLDAAKSLPCEDYRHESDGSWAEVVPYYAGGALYENNRWGAGTAVSRALNERCGTTGK